MWVESVKKYNFFKFMNKQNGLHVFINRPFTLDHRFINYTMVHNIHRVVNKAIYSINTISSKNYCFDKYAILRYCFKANMFLFAAANVSHQDCNGVLSIQTTIINLITMEPHI